MELLDDDLSKKSKYIALKSKGKTTKALQVVESEEDSQDDKSAKRSEDEVIFLSKRIQKIYKKKRFL